MSEDDVLAHAARAVRHDLEATGAWTQDAARALDDGLEHRRWWLSEWPAGAPHVPGLLAQDVQDAVQETADRQWPCCPEHGDHALHVEPDLGPDPFWVCHRSGLPVAPVGGL